MSPHAQEVSAYVDFNVSMAPQNLWRVVSTRRVFDVHDVGTKIMSLCTCLGHLKQEGGVRFLEHDSVARPTGPREHLSRASGKQT